MVVRLQFPEETEC